MSMSIIRDVFTYPFRGRGVYLFLWGAGIFVASDLLAFAPIIGLIAQILIFAYFCSIYFQIIEHTATGSNEAPEFPDTSDLIEDLWRPMIRVLAVLIVSWAPAVIYLLAVQKVDIIFYLLNGVALIYFPMAMLGVCVLGYLGALSPHIVLPAILRAGWMYWFAVLLLIALYFGEDLINETIADIPILGYLVAALLGMYLIMANGRVLGTIYRERREAMRWI